MRMTMGRDALLAAAQSAARVAARGLTPALASVLVEAGDGVASFSATDLEQSARWADMAMVDERGSCLVGAQALAKAVKAMPEAAVTLESGGGTAAVSCGKSSFRLPALDPGDWQGLPADGEGPTARIGADALLSMGKAAQGFAARNHGNAVMCGVHLAFDGSELSVEATDSYRVIRRVAEAEGTGPFDAVVPADFLARAAEQMAGDVVLAYDGNRVRASCDLLDMSTRAVAGKFPNVGMVAPKSPCYALSFTRSEMLSALNRASQLGNGDFPVHLSASGGEARVTAEVKGAGSFSDAVGCDGEVEFDASLPFLRSCVEAMDGEQVSAEGDGALKPMSLRAGSAWAAVMPVRA